MRFWRILLFNCIEEKGIMMKRFFEDGAVVLFQGDSVTDTYRNRDDYYGLGEGYPLAVKNIYDTLFPGNTVRFVNRGVSGDRTRNLVTRYEKDFRDIKPDFVSILIGVNDTWRKFDNNDETPIEVFESNYRTVLENIKRDLPDTKIMLIEPYVLLSKPERAEWYGTLDPMIRVVRKLGREFADYYMSLEGIFNQYISQGYTDEKISEDGVHPSQTGHAIIAYEYLKTLGIL